jgi:hypothetical protein
LPESLTVETLAGAGRQTDVIGLNCPVSAEDADQFVRVVVGDNG